MSNILDINGNPIPKENELVVRVARPILIANVGVYGKTAEQSQELMQQFQKALTDALNNEYHVIVYNNAGEPSFQCFNHNLSEIALAELYKKLGLEVPKPYFE